MIDCPWFSYCLLPSCVLNAMVFMSYLTDIEEKDRWTKNIYLSNMSKSTVKVQGGFVMCKQPHLPLSSSFTWTIPPSSVFPQKSETLLIYLEAKSRCQRKVLPTLTPGVLGNGHGGCSVPVCIHAQTQQSIHSLHALKWSWGSLRG